MPATDGYRLAATVVEPAAGAKDWVVLNAANATPARFYNTFATALAAAGLGAVTYDYRGIAASRPDRLRGFAATITDWALLDLTGVARWVRGTRSPRHLLMVGHSLGGILPGFLDARDRPDALVTVSAPHPYWRQHHGAVRLTHLMLALLTPVVTPVIGYGPWSRLSHAQDVPAGVASQTRTWFLSPDGVLGDPDVPTERFGQFSAPVLAYSIDDDPEAPEPSVDAMAAAFPDVERRHVRPADAGLDHLGHFGFFKPSAESLWGDVVDWLMNPPAP